ncbi:hypothetical protein EDC04DRAFT_2847003, partial [Pisolithus marmoratus]
MMAQQPKAEKLIIKIKPQQALPPVVDDKVDKLLALPLSATDAVSDLLTSQAKIIGSKYNMIDLDDGAEESCEEQEFMVMNKDPYEPQGGEVEEYWPSDRKESPKNGSEITFINLNPSLFSTSGEQKEPEYGPISHSEDESFLQKLSKRRMRKMRAQANLSEDNNDSFTVYVQVWTTSPDSHKPEDPSSVTWLPLSLHSSPMLQKPYLAKCQHCLSQNSNGSLRIKLKVPHKRRLLMRLVMRHFLMLQRQ